MAEANPGSLEKFFGDTCLSSEAGVQQGDPLGPLLFCLALQPALQAASSGLTPPELVMAFLDDVCLAGDYRHVAAALSRLAAAAARQVGLELNPGKCEVVSCAGPDSSADMRAFPAGVQVNPTGAFSFLGAPIGPATYCEAFSMAERVEKARPLLRELAALPDVQTGLLLLRHCASFCRIAYSSRVTPPGAHRMSLASFDADVRGCLEHMCTGPLTTAAWEQASLATSAGGLGLRLASLHAPAYIASLTQTAELCASLLPAYDLACNPNLLSAVAVHNLEVNASDHLRVPVPPQTRQRQLSQALDRAVASRLLAPDPGREASRAHLRLLELPGAGAWLHAPPSEALGLHVEPRLFRTMIQLRLRLPVAPTDVACPLCDGVADRFGDHSRSCPCGGDRQAAQPPQLGRCCSLPGGEARCRGRETRPPPRAPRRRRSRCWPRSWFPQTSGWRSGVCRGLLRWTWPLRRASGLGPH